MINRCPAAVLACALSLSATPLGAQDAPLPAVTVGAGLQTSFVHDEPTGAASTDSFLLNSARLYVNGSAAKKIKFMFNTEYDGAGNHVTVLDAVAQFEISDQVNFWVGRMLPPSDRANLYGPYYAHHWAAFTDGVQDGYPFISAGRDNGALYWGQFGKVKLQAYLKAKGVKAEDISINYTPFGYADWQARVAAIKRFGSAGKKTAVVSTINGDANVPFYKELGNQRISAEDIPVVAFSVGEEELSGLDTKPLVGHLAAWNYFMSNTAPANKTFIDQWHAFIKKPKRTTNDPMEAHYIGFNLWVKAVEKARSTDVEKVLAALPGLEVPNLTGGVAKLLPNHHITKPVYIGEVRADGQFDVVWKTSGTVPGDAWSDYLPGSKDIEADWVTLKCGNYNAKTKVCSGQSYK